MLRCRGRRRTTQPQRELLQVYVLAIDPGVSTGIVLLSAHSVAWAVTCQAPYAELRGALRGYPDAPRVCEKAPTVHRHEAETYDEVTSLLDGDVTYLTPSQWKGHPSSRLSADDLEELQTKHEKEAAGLGRRFLAMRRTHGQESNAHAAGGNA